jgi:hypothetical protein
MRPRRLATWCWWIWDGVGSLFAGYMWTNRPKIACLISASSFSANVILALACLLNHLLNQSPAAQRRSAGFEVAVTSDPITCTA